MTYYITSDPILQFFFQIIGFGKLIVKLLFVLGRFSDRADQVAISERLVEW